MTEASFPGSFRVRCNEATTPDSQCGPCLCLRCRKFRSGLGRPHGATTLLPEAFCLKPQCPQSSLRLKWGWGFCLVVG